MIVYSSRLPADNKLSPRACRRWPRARFIS